jgi:hypothetical protein
MSGAGQQEQEQELNENKIEDLAPQEDESAALTGGSGHNFPCDHK